MSMRGTSWTVLADNINHKLEIQGSIGPVRRISTNDWSVARVDVPGSSLESLSHTVDGNNLNFNIEDGTTDIGRKYNGHVYFDDRYDLNHPDVKVVNGVIWITVMRKV